MIDLEILNKNDFIPKASGKVVLSTCNRTEIYSGDGEIPREVCDHLFRVVCGLKSSLLGEKAIQGQVKEAYISATEAPLSSSIHKLFQTALSVGKRVRTRTGIDRGALSHSQATVDILVKSILDLKDKKITIVGAHNMNEKIIKHLKKHSAGTIFLGNRTYEKAKEIADRHDSKTFRLGELKERLLDSDILITATSAPHPVITEKNFPIGKRMTIVDLARPSDVTERIKNLSNVDYYCVDRVETRVNQNIDKRKVEVVKAEEIINYEIDKFLGRIHGR